MSDNPSTPNTRVRDDARIYVMLVEEIQEETKCTNYVTELPASVTQTLTSLRSRGLRGTEFIVNYV